MKIFLLRPLFCRRAVVYRRCSLQTLLSTDVLLQTLFSADAVLCRRCCLQTFFCRRCSLQTLFSTDAVVYRRSFYRHSFYRRCSLQTLFYSLICPRVCCPPASPYPPVTPTLKPPFFWEMKVSFSPP